MQRAFRAALALVPAVFLLATPAAAGGHRDDMMLHVDMATRIEQRCNARAMGQLGREDKTMRPEEVVAYAFAEPKLGKASIAAPGAAVRSRGHWYHLAYQCRTSADGMEVEDFRYQLGAEVPRNQWDAHSLVE
ncbi:DUF930 domain-containing protein [Xanthobacter tagetidis]|uniref:DUF930 domain-containing protein n=1 Tax=Xanthobacter tagetidis TaxID=60216 RepID=A0A3L7AE55_9HYPH|nr:DUF930 domain-containing protein [Xanthobacter tagetidis]MBB6306119.1 hypothetical protein [Xanthobacter tagetidis]RLP77672.1 DUF930 domain-containing protein [Xanthobacter tagetidis]